MILWDLFRGCGVRGEKNNVDVLVKTSPFPFLSPSPEPEVLFQWNKVIKYAHDTFWSGLGWLGEQSQFHGPDWKELGGVWVPKKWEETSTLTETIFRRGDVKLVCSGAGKSKSLTEFGEESSESKRVNLAISLAFLLLPLLFLLLLLLGLILLLSSS